MPPSDSLVEITKAVVVLLETSALGFKDVWYGDETLIPRTPAVSVVPDRKAREFAGTGHQTLNNFRLQITIFHASLGSTNITRQEADELAEATEALLHTDRYLGGRLIHSLVIEHQPGFVRRERNVFVASRLTWEGMSKTRIGA